MVPGGSVQKWILLMEFISTEYRALAALVMSLAYIIPMCLFPLKAYLLMDWQHLFIVCSLPYLCVSFGVSASAEIE